jgi:hypothetical protein
MSGSSACEHGSRSGCRDQSPSPPPRRPCHRDGGREVIVERVVEKSTAGIVYPMLTWTNYTWVVRGDVGQPSSNGPLGGVLYGGIKICDDRHVLAALLHAVPADMQAGIGNKESMHEAWELIREICIGVDQVKEASAERLRQEFTEIRFKPGEGVEDFSLCITALANELRVLGDEVTDKEVVKKMLHSVPEKMEQVAISMETLLNLNSLPIEEATGHLRTMEQRKKPTIPPMPDADEHLLLMDEEWTTRMKVKEKGSSSGSGGSHNRGRRKGKGRDSGRNGGAASSNARGGHDESMGCDTCHKCGKTDHWVKECHSKAKKEEAHTALDDEPSLLLMEADDLRFESESLLPPPPITSPLPLLILAPWTPLTKWRSQ